MSYVILESYKSQPFQSLSSNGFGYILEGKKYMFFSLIVKPIKARYLVEYHVNSEPIFNHWDKCIATKARIPFSELSKYPAQII